jgi:hypothetical protein
MSNFLGVKYIGKKPRKEDNIFNTGAVWTIGQVINFDAKMAMEFAKHTDSFELADVQPGSGLYEAPKKTATEKLAKEPIGYFNVETMDAEALNLFSMRHFGISVDQSKPIEQIREEVVGMARVDAVFDEELHVEAGEDKHFIALLVNNEEYAAFKAGISILKLVPKPAEGDETGSGSELKPAIGTFSESSTYVAPAEAQTTLVAIGASGGAGLDTLQNAPAGSGADDEGDAGEENSPTREKLDIALAALPAETADIEALLVSLRETHGGFFTAQDEVDVRAKVKTAPLQAPEGAPGAAESTDPQAALRADLDKLEAKALREMCKELGLPVANVMKKPQLIEKILAADKAK